MIKIEKAELVKQVWVINWRGRKIPVELLKNLFLPIFVILVVALALNAGQYTMVEYVKLSAYLSENGIYNPQTGLYEKCHPIHEGNSIIWKCGKPNDINQIIAEANNNTIDYGINNFRYEE